MSKRFAWPLGLGVLVSVALLIACGTQYNSASDGLVVVGSQGSGLLETFSFSLTSGHNAAVSNSPFFTGDETCILNGVPGAIIMDPAGAYAYTILGSNSLCGNGSINIASYKVNSDGTIAQSGVLTPDPSPVALTMDAGGKFLYVLEGLNSYSGAPNAIPCSGTTNQYGVCVYSIGSGGTLTPLPSTFTFNLPAGFQTPNFGAFSLTPTVYPSIGVSGTDNAVCSNPGSPAPTAEYLYVADSVNNVVYEFGVDISTGVVTNPPGQTQVANFATGTTPSGVAVDSCNRFVYVSDMLSNQISAYTMCNGLPTQSPNCLRQNLPAGYLVPIGNGPFSLTAGNGPGPIVVDPFARFVYTLDTISFQVSILSIEQISGALTSTGTANTGQQPVAMAIRGDDNWLFVTNFQGQSLSEYSITPSNGTLTPATAIQTDNNPFGVAVK